MAHFLSNVTHDRLQHRSEELVEGGGRPHLYIPGLLHTHDFYSTIRSVCVIERTPEDERRGTTSSIHVWTGDIDGNISIREGLDGRPVKTIAPINPNTFVYAMVQYEDTVWAGMSNGYLYIYDINTKELLQETKAHSGSITAFLRSGDFIFSASTDWMVCQWNAIERAKVPRGQFSGHQNSVRCLAIDGTMLYSGGDDSVIRCWDLATNLERLGTWPIVAHHDSVRSMVIHEIYLFSSSTDGTINVWNTQTAQLVKQLEICNASITTLTIDSASNYLWAGSTDGLVNIWDVATLTLVGVIDDHDNTNVASVHQIARLNAVKAWTINEDGTVKTYFMDSDPNGNDVGKLTAIESELQTHIEDHRNRIIANYEELERCKAELILLEERDKRKKEVLARVLGNANDKALEAKFISRGRMYFSKARRSEWTSKCVVPLSATENNCKLLDRYWARWGAYARSNLDQRRKEQVSVHMAQYENEKNVRLYLGEMLKVANKNVDRTRHWQLATAQERFINRPLALMYFHKLRRHRNMRALSRKLVDASFAMRDQRDTDLVLAYWRKIRTQARSWRGQQMNRSLMGDLERYLQRQHLARVFTTWQHFIFDKAHRKEQIRGTQIYQVQINRGLMADYFSSWHSLLDLSIRNKQALRRRRQVDEIERLEKFIQEFEGNSPDELDTLVYQKEQELLSARQFANDRVDFLRGAEIRGMQLMRDYTTPVYMDPAAPPLIQLQRSIELLKPLSVNTTRDFIKVNAIRDKVKADSIDVVFKTAVDKLRVFYTKLVKPEKLKNHGCNDWIVGDRIKGVPNRKILQENEHIIEMVVTFDSINPRQLQGWVTKNARNEAVFMPQYAYCNELLANFLTIRELARRAYHISRKEDPETGLPLSAGKLADEDSKKKKKTSKKKKAESPEKKKKTHKKKSSSKKGASVGTAGSSSAESTLIKSADGTSTVGGDTSASETETKPKKAPKKKKLIKKKKNGKTVVVPKKIPPPAPKVVEEITHEGLEPEEALPTDDALVDEESTPTETGVDIRRVYMLPGDIRKVIITHVKRHLVYKKKKGLPRGAESEAPPGTEDEEVVVPATQEALSDLGVESDGTPSPERETSSGSSSSGSDSSSSDSSGPGSASETEPETTAIPPAAQAIPPPSTTDYSVPPTTDYSVPSTDYSVPPTTDYSVPSTNTDYTTTTTDYSVPPTTDYSVPSTNTDYTTTTTDYSVPPTTDYSVPSTTTDYSVPSTDYSSYGTGGGTTDYSSYSAPPTTDYSSYTSSTPATTTDYTSSSGTSGVDLSAYGL